MRKILFELIFSLAQEKFKLFRTGLVAGAIFYFPVFFIEFSGIRNVAIIAALKLLGLICSCIIGGLFTHLTASFYKHRIEPKIDNIFKNKKDDNEKRA